MQDQLPNNFQGGLIANNVTVLPGSGQQHQQIPMVEVPQAKGNTDTIQSIRWTDNRLHELRSIVDTPTTCFTALIAVRPAEIEISCSSETLLDGAMPSGTSFVGTPGTTATMTLCSSFDFVVLRIARSFVAQHEIDIESDHIRPHVFRDPVIETLVRALVDDGSRCDAFKMGLTQALAARILNRGETTERGTGLPKWRLMKFERYIASRLHESVSLEEMADAVGLSRMHFAKSFRIATGFTPHEYLLFKRIEWAKNAMLNSGMNLCEIALEAGFQAQAHFTTVFKRFTGTSPAKWKLENARSA